MTVTAGDAAAARVRSAAARLEALQERARQLHAGVPVSIEHLMSARAWADTQRQQADQARRRLVATHLAAADRHYTAADLLEAAGRTDRADRLRESAHWHEAAARSVSPPAVESVDPAGPPASASTRDQWQPATTGTREPVPDLWLDLSPAFSIKTLAAANRRLTALVSSISSIGAALDDHYADDLWRAVAADCGTEAWRGWSHAVCNVGTRRLPTVSGMAISAFDGALHQPIAASDAWAEAIEELGQVVGEGPSLEAYHSGRAVVIDDLSAQTARWPGYVSALARTGVASVWALPLSIGGVAGAITFYRRVGGSPSPSEWTEVEAFARVGTTAVIGDTEDLADLSRPGSVAGSAMLVHIAMGVIATRLAISPGEALARLRAQAFATNRRLRSVAELVIGDAVTD